MDIRLRIEYEKFLQHPFPSATEFRAGKIRGELAYYCSYTAGYITQVIAGKTLPVTAFTPDTEFREYLQSILESDSISNGEKRVTLDYIAHIDRLKNLVDIAISILSNNKQNNS